MHIPNISKIKHGYGLAIKYGMNWILDFILLRSNKL